MNKPNSKIRVMTVVLNIAAKNNDSLEYFVTTEWYQSLFNECQSSIKANDPLLTLSTFSLLESFLSMIIENFKEYSQPKPHLDVWNRLLPFSNLVMQTLQSFVDQTIEIMMESLIIPSILRNLYLLIIIYYSPYATYNDDSFDTNSLNIINALLQHNDESIQVRTLFIIHIINQLSSSLKYQLI